VPRKVARARLTEVQKPALTDIRSALDDKVPGVLITGDTGHGKSYAAAAMLRERLIECVSGEKYSARWVRSVRFANMAKASWNDRSAMSTYKVIEELGRLKAVVLDDLGVESKSDDYTRSYLVDLVEDREANERWTVVTTNRTLDEIGDWEDRIASRLATFRQVEMTGKDWRLES